MRLAVQMCSKHPGLVPNVIPDRKEASRYELADVRADAGNLQAVDNKVVQPEVEQRQGDIAPGNFGLVLGQCRIAEDPEALQHVVGGPTDDATVNQSRRRRHSLSRSIGRRLLDIRLCG